MDSVLIIAGENSGDRYGAELVHLKVKKENLSQLF